MFVVLTVVFGAAEVLAVAEPVYSMDWRDRARWYDYVGMAAVAAFVMGIVVSLFRAAYDKFGILGICVAATIMAWLMA